MVGGIATLYVHFLWRENQIFVATASSSTHVLGMFLLFKQGKKFFKTTDIGRVFFFLFPLFCLKVVKKIVLAFQKGKRTQKMRPPA